MTKEEFLEKISNLTEEFENSHKWYPIFASINVEFFCPQAELKTRYIYNGEKFIQVGPPNQKQS